MTWYRSDAAKRVHHFNKWVLLTVLILVTVISLSGRIVLSNIEHFKTDIEQLLEGYGIKGLAFDNLQGEWKGLYPFVSIQGASLSIPGRTQSLSISKLEINFKLFDSLLSGRLQLKSLHSIIEKIILVRDSDGLWSLNDIPLQSEASAPQSGLDLRDLYRHLPGYVSVEIGMLQIQDKLRGKEHLIQNSSLISNRNGQQLNIDFITQLPPSLGNQVKVLVSANENKQKLYVHADGVDVAEWANLIVKNATPLHSGTMNLQAWVDLEKFTAKQIKTQTDLFNVKSIHKINQQKPLSFSILQMTEVDQGDWRANLQLNQIVKGQQKLPGFHAQILFGQQHVQPLMWVDSLSVTTVSQLLSDVTGNDDVKKYISQLEPAAMLGNIVSSIDIKQLENSSIGFDFDRLQTKSYQSIPGIKGLSGRFISDNAKSKIDLDSTKVSISFTSLFRDPIEMDEFESQVFLDFSNGKALLHSDTFNVKNADLAMQGRIWMEFPKQGAPFMSLRAAYKDGDAKATKRYLPVSIMKGSLVKWLDDSIQGGELDFGDLIYHGRLEKLSNLQNNQSGEFEALFHVNKPKVSFLPNWPGVSEGELTASFHNLGMSIDVKDARFSTTYFDHVNVNIPDFLNSTLYIKGHTATSAKSVVDTLTAMPILNVIDDVKAKTTRLKGLVETELEIIIPLKKKYEKPRVVASAKLKDVSISIPDWMVKFDRVSGELNVKDELISAPSLKGLYYGDKALLTIQPDVKQHRTNFNLTGNIHSQNLMTLLPESLKQPVKGISNWGVSISLDNRSNPDTPLLTLKATSDLAGTDLSYPLPFKIELDQKKPLSFYAEISKQLTMTFELKLQDVFESIGKVVLSSDVTNRLSLLDVNFGTKAMTSELSTAKPIAGIRMNGDIQDLNVNHWFEYYDQYFSDGSLGTANPLRQVSLIHLNIDSLSFAGQQTENVDITAFNNNQQLYGNLESSQVKGAYELPYKITSESPLKARMEYIKLKKPESAEKEKLSTPINEMPNLDIKSERIVYQDKEFNNLILRTQTEENKFNILQLDFVRNDIALKSSGFWQFDSRNNDNVSVFNIAVKGKDFGKTIDELGLGESLRNGEIDFKGQIGWGAELYNINWPTLIGEVHLSLEDGYLKNVEPGAGRFVGLLSLNALPKRLFLDFGDVVREGTKFKKIEGTFNINGEIMETQNASMDGPSAKVNIIGTTNLRDKTYDQSMIIQPKVGDTLPVIGGLAAGSTVGWGLLLLNKLFNNPIDKSIEIEYKVTGSWEEPDVTLVPRPKAAPEQTGEEMDY